MSGYSYREYRWGPFRYTRTDSRLFGRGVGPSYALVLRCAPWHVKLRRLRGIRVTIRATHWLEMGDWRAA